METLVSLIADLFAFVDFADSGGWSLFAQAGAKPGPGASTIEAVTLGGSAPIDLSIWGILWRADIVVKAVIVILVLASFWSWAIMFEKIMSLRRVNRRTTAFEEAFWSGGSMDTLFERVGDRPGDPMAAIFSAAMREWRRSDTTTKGPSGGAHASLQERVDKVMQVTLSREIDRLERNIGFLASVGATAPFIGLFGTVWGIMNSFQAIAQQKNTNLAVVAPGIAEALFATALGLVAAIPAVIAYNKLSNDLGRYASRLESFGGEFGAILSRELDRGHK